MMAELAPQDKTGSYKRPSYSFGGKIGGADGRYPDEAGRYHLYVGNPCPWCHRARLVLALRSITNDEIGMTQLVDDPVKASRGGWIFSQTNRDPLGSTDLRELYDKLSPGFTGRCTAPLLVDLKTRKIVSNESSDIVRMLNSVHMGKINSKERIELYPSELAKTIDETNAWVYELLNNGVYRCGFSTSQGAYDRASADVRQGLQKCEEILSKQPFLCGERFTESDLMLLPTVLRFDGAYSPLFKAGGVHVRLRDYPALFAWLQRCWDMDGVRDTIDLADATSSYYRQLFPLNAGGIIPTPITPEDIGLSS
uniref:GST C-terminal domain-containing protein n=3 Tax=Ditylum brightwellii TaxID=49249 RepID=A0A6V2B0T7_9STRA